MRGGALTGAAGSSPAEALLANIEAMGRDLRPPLQELLEELGGAPPRPARLVRSIGLDKSLAGQRASRSVRQKLDARAVKAIGVSA